MADEWNRMARIVEGLSKLSVAPPLQMLRTPNGTTLRIASHAKDFFIGRIHDDGPGAPGNYADQRYWIVEQEITNSGEADTTDLTWADRTNGLWVTATNLAEVQIESHYVPDDNDLRVVVFRSYDQSPIARYHFYWEAESFLAKVTPDGGNSE